MRTLLIAAFVCTCALFASVPAQAEDAMAPVPKSIADISDQAMKDAVAKHSPHYDELGRGSQVFTYVHIYKSLNDGRSPELNPDDAEFVAVGETEAESVPSDVLRHYDSVPSVMDSGSAGYTSGSPERVERYISEVELLRD